MSFRNVVKNNSPVIDFKNSRRNAEEHLLYYPKEDEEDQW